MLFQNKLQVSRSQVLQSFWSALMRTKFWKNPKKKKTISIKTIKTCPSYESYFANQKNCGNIDLILTVHLSKSWNDEEKSLFWYKITKPRYNGILFKNIHFHFFFFGKSFNLFFKNSYWIFQICKQLCCTTTKTTIYCTQCKQFTSSWLTNISVAEFWRNRGYYMAARR